MIKPINISPLNTSRELYYECPKGHNGKIILQSIVNTDDEDKAMEDLSGYNCEKCDESLDEKPSR